MFDGKFLDFIIPIDTSKWLLPKKNIFFGHGHDRFRNGFSADIPQGLLLVLLKIGEVQMSTASVVI